MLPRPLHSTVQQTVRSTSLGPSLLSENYGREKYVQGQSSETRKKENDLKILSNVKALFEILKRVEDGDAFEHSRAIVRKANHYNYHCANRGGFKRGLPVRPRNWRSVLMSSMSMGDWVCQKIGSKSSTVPFHSWSETLAPQMTSWGFLFDMYRQRKSRKSLSNHTRNIVAVRLSGRNRWSPSD